LQEELRANLSLALEDAAGSGLSPEEAARRARCDFGSLTRADEETRAVWFPGWDTLSQDVRFAVRTLARTPGFTLVAVLSLALGTGAATALFSLVDTVVLKPLAYREPGRLVFVREVVPPLAHIYPTLPVNIQHLRFWQEQARSFDSLAGLNGGSAMLLTGGEPEVVGGAWVTANFFDALGVEPQLGRAFQPGEDQPGKGGVVVIADGLWRRRFGASREIVGQSIRLDGALYLVVGVLPASFRFPKKDDLGPLTRLAERTEFFLPVQQVSPGWGGDYDYVVFGRLRRGMTPALRLSHADPQNALRAGTHTISGSRHGLQLREWLVGAEVSLSTLLLVLAGLLVSSLWHVLRVDRGFAADRALEVRVSLPSRYQTDQDRAFLRPGGRPPPRVAGRSRGGGRQQSTAHRRSQR